MNKYFSLIVYITILFVFAACSKDDENVITPPEAEESFLNGTWHGSSLEEQTTIDLTATLKNTFGNVTGSGNVVFTNSDDASNISIEFTNDVSAGQLVNSQISFTIESPADSSYVIYNGGVSKTDSTKIVGNCTFYAAVDHRIFTFAMTLGKND